MKIARRQFAVYPLGERFSGCKPMTSSPCPHDERRQRAQQRPVLRQHPPEAPLMSSNFIDAINESNAGSPATDGAAPFELFDMTTRGEDRRAVLRFGFPHKQYVAPYQ